MPSIYNTTTAHMSFDILNALIHTYTYTIELYQPPHRHIVYTPEYDESNGIHLVMYISYADYYIIPHNHALFIFIFMLCAGTLKIFIANIVISVSIRTAAIAHQIYNAVFDNKVNILLLVAHIQYKYICDSMASRSSTTATAPPIPTKHYVML